MPIPIFVFIFVFITPLVPSLVIVGAPHLLVDEAGPDVFVEPGGVGECEVELGVAVDPNRPPALNIPAYGSTGWAGGGGGNADVEG